jgi:tetratricopeptide (TPR) repeat protein
VPSSHSRPLVSAWPEFEFTFRHDGAVLARFSGSSCEFLIGSDVSCDIVLDIKGISPQHARLSVGFSVVITDLESGVGTFVDGEEIARQREVHSLESITFGSAEGELRLEATANALRVEAPSVEDAFEASALEPRAESNWNGTGIRDTPPVPNEAGSFPARSENPGETWGEQMLPSDGGWAKALLLQAAKPRQAEVFGLPAAPGGEVSVNWSRQPEIVPESDLLPETAPAPPPQEEKSDPAVAAEPERPVTARELKETLLTIPEAAWVAPTIPDAAPVIPGVSRSSEPLSPDLSEEVCRLNSELATVKERLKASSRNPPQNAPADNTFLSMANGFLLKKMAATADVKKKVGELTAELKQREIALVEAWSRRQASEERCLELSRRLAERDGEGSLAEPGRDFNHKHFWIGVAAVALVVTLLSIKLREAARRAKDAESVVLLLRNVAPQLHREAEEALVAGEMEEALSKVERALALEPENADYYRTQGRVFESLLRIPAAQEAYERAVVIKPSLVHAHASLELCRRIAATRGGVEKVENLYGLHRVMMEQNRLSEALRIAQKIPRDFALLHRTWEAILQAGGIRGELRLNKDGTFDLELALGSNSDLAPLRGLPLRALKAARANISDLSPLSGMVLRRLDVAETLVRDISMLRGMPLEALDISNTAVTNLVPLRGMPLRELRMDYTSVTDLSDLAALPLRSLSVMSTRVRSVGPLSQMPLRQLNLAHTGVKEIAALKRARIEELNLEGTLVTDLTPLVGMPLTVLNLSATPVRNLEPLRGMLLRELRLVACREIASLESLAACSELERLVLPRRDLDQTPLRGLGRLRFLSYESAAANDQIPAPALSVTREAAVTQNILPPPGATPPVRPSSRSGNR